MTKVPIWRAPRISYCAQGRVWVKLDRSECHTVNLSESGLLAVVSVPCPPGTAIRVDLPLPGYDRPMPIPGVVVRETEFEGEYAVGVKFDKLLPGSLEALRAFVQAELATNRSSDAVPAMHVTGTRSTLDLNELYAGLPTDNGLDDDGEEPPAADGTDEQPVPDDELEETGARRSTTEVRRVKRRALQRLRREAAARAQREVSAPDPAPDRPPREASVPTAEIEDVPEWVDGPRQIYDEEERELIRESEQDEKLKHLYRAAVADVEQTEREREAKTRKKKKGWF